MTYKLSLEQRAHYIHNSNAIEGIVIPEEKILNWLKNPLDWIERKIRNTNLQQFMLVGAVLDHNSAIEYVIQNYNKQKITEKDVLNIHKILMKKMLDNSVGEYRKVNVNIVGVNSYGKKHIVRECPDFSEVPELMKKLFTYRINRFDKDKTLSKRRILDSHYEFEYIHPFVDGNGRTGRLFLNMLMLRHGYDFITILNEGKEENYYKKIAKYIDRKHPREIIPKLETLCEEDIEKFKPLNIKSY